MMGSSNTSKLRSIEKQMRYAASYGHWEQLAQKYDLLSGLAKWQQLDYSPQYDYSEISARRDKLQQLKGLNDLRGLLFNLNEGIHGNMGGMGRPVLYSHAKSGTKHLIDSYIEEITESLRLLAADQNSGIPAAEKRDFFERASHCFGRSALMLSGAGTLGLFHLGVIKALVEADVLPDVISGSSAGAMIAASAGTHRSEDFAKFFDAKNLSIESDIQANFIDWLLPGNEERLDAGYCESMINHFVADLTFQEAFELTGKAINISVSPTEKHQSARLLNAITSPNVLVRSAVHASCAVPGALAPVTLQAKSERGFKIPYLPTRKWQDGSFSMDLPAKRLSRLYGVNHFLVSQINPAVIWVLTDPKTDHGIVSSASRLCLSAIKGGLSAGAQASRQYLKGFPKLYLLAGQLEGLVKQQYTGDVNIFPNFRFFDPRLLVKRWSQKDIEFLVQQGEKATWPKIAMIRNCVKISKQLDSILAEDERGNKAAPSFVALGSNAA